MDQKGDNEEHRENEMKTGGVSGKSRFKRQNREEQTDVLKVS